jgi:hypothetical protein
MQPTYAASFRNLDLAIQVSDNRWLWTVTNRDIAETVAHGERPDRESAMVEAAEAAQADWGSVKWRRPDDIDD